MKYWRITRVSNYDDGKKPCVEAVDTGMKDAWLETCWVIACEGFDLEAFIRKYDTVMITMDASDSRIKHSDDLVGVIEIYDDYME